MAKQKSGSIFLYDDSNNVIGVKDSDGVERFFPRHASEAAAARGVTLAASDVVWLTSATTPVDYTDGDPAATGEAVAGKGSLCTALDTGKLYVNGGTKAQPVWKIVTSAA